MVALHYVRDQAPILLYLASLWSKLGYCYNTVPTDRRGKDREGWLLPLSQSFSTLSLFIIYIRYFFAVGGCPMHCGMFSSISGLYPVDANNITPTQL